MTIYKEFNIGGNNKSPFGGLTAVLGLAVFFIILYFVAKGLFTILSWVAPFLLVAALVVDYTVVTDFGKFVLKLLKENPVMGGITVILSFFGFPVLFGYLFFKAIVRKKLKQMGQTMSNSSTKYTEYEEVEDDESFLELPELKKETESKSNYDDLFK